MLDKDIEKCILEIQEKLKVNKEFLATYEIYNKIPHKCKYAYKDIKNKEHGLIIESFNNNPDVFKTSLRGIKRQEENGCERESLSYISNRKILSSRVTEQYFWSLRSMISRYNRLIDVNNRINKINNYIKSHNDDDFMSKIYKEKALPDYSKEYGSLIDLINANYSHYIKMDKIKGKVEIVYNQLLHDRELKYGNLI